MSSDAKNEITCACPPSHRRLRRVLSSIIVVLVVCLGVGIIYLEITGGFNA